MVNPQSDVIPVIQLTSEMLDFAKANAEAVRVHRTVASPVDAESGILGELVFAEWLWGDWESHHEVLTNNGAADFLGKIEVKTSVFPFSSRLNLPVREDYAAVRTPDVYVWVCIDVPSRNQKALAPGLNAKVVGWTDAETAHSGQLRYMDAARQYRCYLTPVPELRPMDDFRTYLNKHIPNYLDEPPTS